MSEPRLLLADIIRNTHDLSTAKGWPRRSAAERMVSVRAELVEVEEALEELARAQDLSSDVEAARAHVAEEVFDVIWNLCDLTEILGVNLEEASRAKMAHNATRTWPACTGT